MQCVCPIAVRIFMVTHHSTCMKRAPNFPHITPATRSYPKHVKAVGNRFESGPFRWITNVMLASPLIGTRSLPVYWLMPLFRLFPASRGGWHAISTKFTRFLTHTRYKVQQLLFVVIVHGPDDFPEPKDDWMLRMVSIIIRRCLVKTIKVQIGRAANNKLKLLRNTERLFAGNMIYGLTANTQITAMASAPKDCRMKILWVKRSTMAHTKAGPPQTRWKPCAKASNCRLMLLFNIQST